jgi:N-acetyl-anhydromuramyl-L-alanine amidase AmpD
MLLSLTGCVSGPTRGSPGGSIVVAGVAFDTGAPVITWKDAGGYDAYQEQRHFEPSEILPSKPARGCNTPRRYGTRSLKGLESHTAARVGESGYDLAALREKVDQFVIHYDVCGTSRRCFKVLHDLRGLSVHFLLDIDGTIYQTMDLAERGRHATISNDRSVGIEIAHIGAYPGLDVLRKWYVPETSLDMRIQLPESMGDGGVRTPAYTGRPRRRGLFEQVLNGNRVVQYDFTDAQYQSLARLARALNRALPKIRLRVPRGPDGEVVPKKLPAGDLDAFQGVLGHYHIQTNKSDPGPAFDWDYLLRTARTLRP